MYDNIPICVDIIGNETIPISSRTVQVGEQILSIYPGRYSMIFSIFSNFIEIIIILSRVYIYII